MPRQMGPEVERMLRVTLNGICYEAQFDADGNTTVAVYGKPMGDQEVELELTDIEALMEFLNEVLGGEQGGQEDEVEDFPRRPRRSRASAADRPTARGGDDDRIPGGQGRVKDPEHDARLKGNEDLRGDRDRSAQAEGGRRGGLSRRGMRR